MLNNPSTQLAWLICILASTSLPTASKPTKSENNAKFTTVSQLQSSPQNYSGKRISTTGNLLLLHKTRTPGIRLCERGPADDAAQSIKKSIAITFDESVPQYKQMQAVTLFNNAIVVVDGIFMPPEAKTKNVATIRALNIDAATEPHAQYKFNEYGYGVIAPVKERSEVGDFWLKHHKIK